MTKVESSPKKSFVRVKPAKTSRPRSKEILEAEIVEDDENSERTFDAELVDDPSQTSGLDSERALNEILPLSADGKEHFENDEDDESDDAEVVIDEKALMPSSALQRYLAELRKYSLMTREQEKEVAIRAYEYGDLQAKNRLVTSNLRLVVKIAMEYRRAYSQILDLIQEGNAGLVQAVNRFNPYIGVKLSTYSAWWIRAYILKFLMDNKSLVRMGTTDAQRKLFFRLRGEAEKMYALTQKFDAKLLAENIGVKETDVIDMHQRLTKNDFSLDSPVGNESDTRHIDNLVSSQEKSLDETIDHERLLTLVRQKSKELEAQLNERDLFIFQNRILADDPVTLQDVGHKYGITRERARQLESRVIKRMKELLLESGAFES
jgi:RNA polymerase sigma-32 factor